MLQNLQEDVFQNVLKRVREGVSSSLSRSECLQISISCSARDCESVIGFLLSHQMAKRALSMQDTLKLTSEEWDILFSCSAYQRGGQELNSFVNLEPFQKIVKRIQEVARLTLQEKDQASYWRRSWTKLLVYIALHLDYSDDAIYSCLDSVIKADQRRIEDYITEIDDQGIEIVLFCQSIKLICDACDP